MACGRLERTAADLFGAFDAAMLRVGLTIALTGLLLQALNFILPWPPIEMNAALSLAGAMLAVIGAYGCHRSRREEREATLASPVSEGKAN